jgi:hypothetical protein
MSTPPTQFSAAQWSFIKKVRASVDSNAKAYFLEHNWRNITPAGGRFDSGLLDPSNRKTTTAEAFYIKAVACWVPHKLIPNHVPKCPQCEKNRYVDPTKGRWVNSPKILYGVERHRYLDTFLYPCRNCQRTFTGYNKKSMQLDAAVYYSYFTFYLGDRYAVDDELYRKIVLETTTEATACVQKRLWKTAHDVYIEDQRMYYCAVGQKKVKRHKTLLHHFQRNKDDSEYLLRLKRKKADAMSLYTNMRLSYLSARKKADTDIEFKTLLQSKENHNVVGDANIVAGLGPAKIARLIRNGLYSTKAVLNANGAQYPDICHLLPNWRKKIKDYYEGLRVKVDYWSARMRDAQQDLDSAEIELAQHEEVPHFNREVPVNPYRFPFRRNAHPVVPEQSSTPEFSSFGDKKGYNARVISKFALDSVVTSVFNHRKAFMEAKMKCLCASIVKIDFNYKLASKIRVWTKQGHSFCPYKCIVTIQNEDGLTIFWKALKQSESFAEIKEDLLLMRHRLNRNAVEKLAADEAIRKQKCLDEGKDFVEKFLPANHEAVKVAYVDNCCNVKNIVRSCFPNCLIKLVVFHWLKRWNLVLMEPSSAQGGIFRGLMSRALFCIEPGEYEDAKQRVREKLVKKKLQRDPMPREIIKEARSIIPEPEALRKNVEAVLSYINAKDCEIELSLSTRADDDTSPAPKRFLKSTGIRQLVRDQLRHVDCGCLSDPPVDVVNIWRLNLKSGITYVSRGTNTNERDNLDLAHKILVASHIGKYS